MDYGHYSPCSSLFAIGVDCRITKDQEEFHRQWIVLMADKSEGSSASEWALAWFALDNLLHRTCHASADIVHLRRSCAASSEIELQAQSVVKALSDSHRSWRERRVVKEADQMERLGQSLPTFTSSTNSINVSMIFPTAETSLSDVDDPSMQFLDYPPIHLTNIFYANMLNHWRSIQIAISLIAEPMWGTTYPSRLECAIDICRTHAALGQVRNFLNTGKLWGLHLAGVVFGGPQLYPVTPLSASLSADILTLFNEWRLMAE